MGVGRTANDASARRPAANERRRPSVAADDAARRDQADVVAERQANENSGLPTHYRRGGRRDFRRRPVPARSRMPLVSSGRTFPSISSVVDAREGHQSSTEMILTPWDLWMAAIVVLAVCYETRPRFRYWTRFSMYFGVTMCIAILFMWVSRLPSDLADLTFHSHSLLSLPEHSPVAMLRPKNVHNTVWVSCSVICQLFLPLSQFVHFQEPSG